MENKSPKRGYKGAKIPPQRLKETELKASERERDIIGLHQRERDIWFFKV